MKKLVSLLVALLMVLTMASAVAESDVTTVKLIVPSDHLEFMEQLFVPFMEANPDIKVEVDGTANGWDGVSTKVITMLAGGEQVDIAAVSTSYYPQFASLGQLLDITDHAKETYSEDEYYWSVFDGLMIDGRLYGVPISVYTLVNYINKDMYDAASVAYPSLEWGESAWTYEDWKNIAKTLSQGEGLDRQYGVYIEYQLERTACFLFPEGLNYWGEDLKPQFDNERIREIHRELYTMLHEDAYMPNADTVATTGMDQLFADGKVANYITGTWSHSSLAKAGVNLGVSPTPGGKTVGYVDVYIPMASTEHPDETLRVLDYLISYDACVMKYENDRLGPQVNKKATEDCKDRCFSGLTSEEVDCIFASLDNCQPLTVFPQWAEFLSDSLLPESSLMAYGEETVDEAFDELQEAACDLLGF